eukprot:538234_1
MAEPSIENKDADNEDDEVINNEANKAGILAEAVTEKQFIFVLSIAPKETQKMSAFQNTQEKEANIRSEMNILNDATPLNDIITDLRYWFCVSESTVLRSLRLGVTYSHPKANV